MPAGKFVSSTSGAVKTADLCPSTFIGTQANWNIEDPKGQPLEVFRRVRDEIKAKVEELAKQKVANWNERKRGNFA